MNLRQTASAVEAKHLAREVADALAKLRTLSLYAPGSVDAIERSRRDAREALEALNLLAPELGIAPVVVPLTRPVGRTRLVPVMGKIGDPAPQPPGAA